MNLVDLILHRDFDTPMIRSAARFFGIGVLFLVLMGARSRAESAPVAHDSELTSTHVLDDTEATSHPQTEAESHLHAPEHEAAEMEPAVVVQEESAAARTPVAGYTREERLLHRLHYFTQAGVDLWAQGDREGAETAFAKAVNVNLPAEHKRDLLLQMAELYEDDGQLAKAIGALEKLYAADPDDVGTPEVLLQLGILYRETGAYDLARKRFFQVLNSTLSVTPETFDANRKTAMKARLEIAETYAAQGNFKEARRYFSRLQRLDLNEADLELVKFRETQLQYQLEDWRVAADQFGEFLEEYPESRHMAEARYLRSKALEHLELRDEAMQEVVTLLSTETDPSANAQDLAYWQRRSGNEMANRFYEQGDFHGALSVYQALARASADPSWRWPAVYQIGLCFERLNLPQRAAEAYQLIVSPEENQEEESAEPLSEALVALRGMAEWRLEHLDWIEDFENRVHVLTATPDA